MATIFELATTYKELLPFLGAAIAAFFAALWTVLQFALTHRRERKKHIFETYHKLVDQLVDNGGPNGVPRIDRQCAIVYELRFYPRYRSVTRRMLKGLRASWSASLGPRSRIVEEIDLTLEAIKPKFWESD